MLYLLHYTNIITTVVLLFTSFFIHLLSHSSFTGHVCFTFRSLTNTEWFNAVGSVGALYKVLLQNFWKISIIYSNAAFTLAQAWVQIPVIVNTSLHVFQWLPFTLIRSQRYGLIVQFVPAVTKDIFVWTVGPRRSVNHFFSGWLLFRTYKQQRQSTNCALNNDKFNR